MANLANLYSPQDQVKSVEAIPAGEYKAVIVASESKRTKAGDGEYLELEHQIIEGEYAGRKLYSRLNLQSKNPKAVEIARSDLAQIRNATGKLNPRDSIEFHNIPILIRVVYLLPDPAKNRENPQNDIKAWKPIAGVALQQAASPAPYLPPQQQQAFQQQPQAYQQPAQQAPAAALPWQR